MAKRVRISSDDSTYYTLPGNSAELRDEAGQLTDTIFGQNFESTQPGMIAASLNTNAIYKGFAGYVVKISKGGTPTTMTGEACSLVSGKTYQINDTTKHIIDIDTAVVVNDNGSPVAASDIESINYLTGQVTFVSGYTVTGAVTITGKYIPKTEIAGSKSWTLTQGAAVIDDSDIPTARANSGHRVYAPNGLKSVSIEIGSNFKSSNAWRDVLVARSKVYIEINPDNSDLSIARGIFKLNNRSQSGDVGALEEETVNFMLYVPQNDEVEWATPFTWIHSGSTTLNQGIIKLLEALLNETEVYAMYLHDGTNGWKWSGCPVQDISISGGLEAMNEFSVALQLSGAATAVP